MHSRIFNPFALQALFSNAIRAKVQAALPPRPSAPQRDPQRVIAAQRFSGNRIGHFAGAHNERSRKRWMTRKERGTRSIISMIAKGMWAHPSKDPNRDTVWLGNFEIPYQQAVNLGCKIFEGDAKREWLMGVKSDKFAAFKNFI